MVDFEKDTTRDLSQIDFPSIQTYTILIKKLFRSQESNDVLYERQNSTVTFDGVKLTSSNGISSIGLVASDYKVFANQHNQTNIAYFEIKVNVPYNRIKEINTAHRIILTFGTDRFLFNITGGQYLQEDSPNNFVAHNFNEVVRTDMFTCEINDTDENNLIARINAIYNNTSSYAFLVRGGIFDLSDPNRWIVRVNVGNSTYAVNRNITDRENGTVLFSANPRVLAWTFSRAVTFVEEVLPEPTETFTELESHDIIITNIEFVRDNLARIHVFAYGNLNAISDIGFRLRFREFGSSFGFSARTVNVIDENGIGMPLTKGKSYEIYTELLSGNNAISRSQTIIFTHGEHEERYDSRIQLIALLQQIGIHVERVTENSINFVITGDILASGQVTSIVITAERSGQIERQSVTLSPNNNRYEIKISNLIPEQSYLIGISGFLTNEIVPIAEFTQRTAVEILDSDGPLQIRDKTLECVLLSGLDDGKYDEVKVMDTDIKERIAGDIITASNSAVNGFLNPDKNPRGKKSSVFKSQASVLPTNNVDNFWLQFAQEEIDLIDDIDVGYLH